MRLVLGFFAMFACACSTKGDPTPNGDAGAASVGTVAPRPANTSANASAMTSSIAPTTTSIASAAPPPCPPRTGRVVVLRWDGPHEVVEKEIARCLSDPERALLGWASARVSSQCDWKSDTGSPPDAKMDCPLTTAIGLFDQCGERHKAFLTQWLGEDQLPPQCARIPMTAFHQSVWDEIGIETRDDHIIMDMKGIGTDGPTSKGWQWSERHEVEVVDGKRLKWVKKTIKGSPTGP
jgi:hypothetical protein